MALADELVALKSEAAIKAAAKWLMEDDSAYENEPVAAERAAKAMIDTALAASAEAPGSKEGT